MREAQRSPELVIEIEMQALVEVALAQKCFPHCLMSITTGFLTDAGLLQPVAESSCLGVKEKEPNSFEFGLRGSSLLSFLDPFRGRSTTRFRSVARAAQSPPLWVPKMQDWSIQRKGLHVGGSERTEKDSNREFGFRVSSSLLDRVRARSALEHTPVH